MIDVARANRYQVADQLFLWWLADPRDRQAGLRLHCLSAHVALRAAGERFGYPELAQLLRRRGPVARVVDRWHEHFKRSGVSRADIASYAEHIDRPFLREQRTEFLSKR